ncbi:uncharacterized protein LOC131231646 isoform X1 [Magnolia sinica]|uniref:uncharacterized protein LOC131231646 isoform X1 n=1 Tax=Magnolia sinica TaxID=86752 RepID=UPI0026596120|nr:uncharacterized protein LOC131231646 isoform X1 [Magnolia sinica]XP_058083895.1 uncharacterized protein LOC131231646 isoform X1 [Magnolia sinica]
MALLLFLSSPTRTPQNPNPNPKSLTRSKPSDLCFDSSKRDFTLKTAAISLLSLTLSLRFSPDAAASAETVSRKPFLSGISNTKSWFQVFGDGFSIRIPPQFDDVTEPEDYNAGFSFYGDKAKTKVYAARFASLDRSEVVSVVIRPSNQLKITFLEAKDVTDLGTLKEAAPIFVPGVTCITNAFDCINLRCRLYQYMDITKGGASLYSARTIKIKEDEGFRSYYFYEFGVADQHVALVAAVSSGKAFIAGAAAPESKWEDDGIKLRSAAISLSVL